MAPYDSDSEEGDEEEFTETNILLGYASKEAGDDTISYLGGKPTWIDPTTPPSSALAKCKICNELMVLLLQLNGELPNDFPGHERRLYVWSCKRKMCRRKEGSVRVARGLRVTEQKENRSAEKKEEIKVEKKQEIKIGLGESLFGGKPRGNSANPFSNPFSSPASAAANPFSTTTKSTANLFATAGLGSSSELAAKTPQAPSLPSASDLPKTFASALSLNNDQPKFGPPPPPEPWPAGADLPKPYPLYYFVDTDYETLDKIEDLPIPTQTMDLDEPPGSSGGKEDKDVYESTIDKTFQKFADRLAQNPEQVIRYEFRGSPLLYSKKDTVGKMLSGKESNAKVRTTGGSGSGMPRCTNCGAGRVLEVQLTPHAIMELEREETSLDGMEWGTIIVGVCEKDCQQRGVDAGMVGYVEEWAGVQWEEAAESK